ncbi:hypothetical protein COO60DRAFT_1673833 [Scenedesmus sp. NREL 46B-D3]|nr:hypothetical protein COO60DRAFT_1673833 [Scenedesmus sp. NREL 46B-D3]
MLQLPAAIRLKLQDVQMAVSQQQLQQYAAFLRQVPSAVFATDNATFIHVRNFSSSMTAAGQAAAAAVPAAGDGGSVVDAYSVTLIAQAAASINNMPFTALQAMTASRGGQQRQYGGGTGGADEAAVAAAAAGDTDGVITTTDSYVLAATNSTLLQLLQQLNSQQVPPGGPLLIHLATNVSLAPRFWGSAWPAGGLAVRRSVVFVGSSWQPTSIDLGMEVGQVLMQGEAANITMFNLALENLAYGDEASGVLADGTSILLPSQLWAFHYRRARPRLVLWDCTLVLPEQQFIDALVFWASAFTSAQQGQSFWRERTDFLRRSLRYTQFRVSPDISSGASPGTHVINAHVMKDRLVFNTTLTTQPAAAAALPLPFNASIHQRVAPGEAAPAVGPIFSIEDLVLSLYNIQKVCGRVITLLPSPADGSGVFSWGRAPALNFSRVGGDPIPGENVPLGAPGTPNAAQHDSGGAGARAGTANRTAAGPLEGRGAASLAQQLPASWPPSDGPWLVQCPVQFQGTQMLDLGFVRGMFELQDPSSPPGGRQAGSADSSSSSSIAGLRSVGGRRPLMRFAQMNMQGLPQGNMDQGDGNSSSSSGGGGSSAQSWQASVGGSSWVSALPAEAYTHLLWFVTRNIAVTYQLSLVNVTLLIPPQEAEHMAAAARAAIDAAAGTNDQPVLSIIYPTAAGPLPVVYRSLSVTHGTAAGQQALSAAAAADTGTSPERRRLLAAAAGVAGNATAELLNQLTVCVGSVRGLGLVGSNVCMTASTQSALPPGYAWREPFDAGSGDAGGWPAWQAAVVALAVSLPVLAAVAFLFVVVRRRRQRKLRQYMQRQLPATDSSSEACAASGHSSSSHSTAAVASKEQLLPCAAASGQGSSAQQQHHHWQQWHNPVLAKLSAGAVSRNSAVVDQGAHVVLHAGTAAPVGASTQQQRLVGGANQQQRLAGAISIVSAGLQARRLGGLSSSRSGSNPDAGEAAAAAVAAAGAGDAGMSRVASLGSGGAAAAMSRQQRLVKAPSDEGAAPAGHQQQQSGSEVDAAEPSGAVGGHQRAQRTRQTAAGLPTTTAAAAARVSHAAAQQLQLHEPVGQGTFGVVFRATWRGIPSAVKLMQLPAAVKETLGAAGLAAGAGGRGGGSSSREQMAVMEAAVGASINHPNVVQVYTYNLRPMGHLVHRDSSSPSGSGTGSSAAKPPHQQQQQQQRCAGRGSGSGASCDSCGSSAAVTGYELQLVMEYCPLGSLRAALDSCLLEDRVTGAPHYATVLGLALGVARAMHHLHSEGVLHGDLKAGNVLLKLEVGPASAAAAAAGAATPLGPGGSDVLVAKVADLGLACLLDDQDTHISGVHRGTLTHMSPELLLHGRASRASDVYAYGILLWDLATGQRAFEDVPKVLLGAAVVRDRLRPAWLGTEASSSSGGFPGATTCQQQQQGVPGADDAGELQPPLGFRRLAEACWAHQPQDRPTFAEVTATLEQLIRQEQQRQAEFEAFAQQLLQQQQQQSQAAVGGPPAAGSAAEAAARQHSTASNSSSTAGASAGSNALAGSRKVRFSADVDKILLPSNQDEDAIRVSVSLDRPASGGQQGAVRRGSGGAAAAVAAVLGVRWERPQASPSAPYAAQISIDKSSKPAAAEMNTAKLGAQMDSSPAGSQQDPVQGDCKLDAGQQRQQHQLAAADSSARSSDVAAAHDADCPAGSAGEGRELGQAAPAAAAAAPFSPFGNLKDQPWE